MKIAYLIFAYKNPKLIKKIIERLSCENATFFIHLDSKSDINLFADIRGENVVFTDERLTVYWAEFTGVRAILTLIRQALAADERYDYFVLLSGSEYPLRSGEYIHSFLETHRGTEYINMVKMPNVVAGKPMSRITLIRYPVINPVRRFLFRCLAKVGLAHRDYRKYLRGLEPYGGNTWWALTREACQYISDYDRNNRFFAEYCEHVYSPEEYYIHTILGNSPFLSRQRRSLLYEDWTRGGSHPAMLNQNHLDFFASQQEVRVTDVHGPGELLFARKCSDDNLEIVRKIDAMIDRKDKKHATIASLPSQSVAPGA